MKSSYALLSEKRILKLLSKIYTSPGVFLETSYLDRNNHKSLLFSSPKRILTFNLGGSLNNFFKEAEDSLSAGLWLAGYFTYEFGYLFEPKLKKLLSKKRISFPLSWIGIFPPPKIISHKDDTLPVLGKPAQLSSYRIKGGRLNTRLGEYREAIGKIKTHLLRGDTYQVNYTLKYKGIFSGDIKSFYLQMRRKQPTSFSGVVNDGKRMILSLSPELFFRVNKRRIVTKPMKGTYPRGRTFHQDRENKEFLPRDLKNRAENIMIVDLLRNDLGKIACKGSVKVPRCFNVEEYPSLFQMTSTVKAKLKKNEKLGDLFKALFPSGSVTGAPKIRTMQIINRLEKEPRDVYTGSVGFVSPSGESCFNVAIRTVIVDKNRVECGLGGGIIYDSSPLKEYEEVLLKSQFLREEAVEKTTAPDYSDLG